VAPTVSPCPSFSAHCLSPLLGKLSTWYPHQHPQCQAHVLTNLEIYVSQIFFVAVTQTSNLKEEAFILLTVAEASVHRGVEDIAQSSSNHGDQEACLCWVAVFFYPTLFNLGPQPMGWCHPHTGWDFPLSQSPWKCPHSHRQRWALLIS
jgi:hypothetical protein